mmetsp:Transcript_61549/g.146843  ORF Transcript_61549/g.146843 Transcript_61549/m.146843 type:complete len:231 (+) Transcript_61549:244-936(+)
MLLGRKGFTNSLHIVQSISRSSSSSAMSASSKAFIAKHSEHCQSRRNARLPHGLMSSSDIKPCNPIHATCFGQQPVPFTLQLRARWHKLFQRVVRGVATKVGRRGLPSSTTAEHAFASFFLRIKRALVSSALGTVDAVRGAGGFDFSSTCTPKVLVSTTFFATAVVAAAAGGGFCEATALPLSKLLPSQETLQLLKERVPRLLGAGCGIAKCVWCKCAVPRGMASGGVAG